MTDLAAPPQSELQRRLRAIPAPRPMLTREAHARLTERQRELLHELGRVFADGFADLTMAEVAARLGCSLRTLYGLAPSRDELVLAVADGHGGAAYTRSHIGAAYAVKIALRVLARQAGTQALGQHGAGAVCQVH